MVDEYPEISGITNAREAMKKMPEPDRARIAEQVSTLRFLTTFECKNIIGFEKLVRLRYLLSF